MADFEQIIVSGQSLSVGWNGTPLISTATENANAQRINPATGDGGIGPMQGNHPLYPDWQLPEFALAYRVAAAAGGSLVGVATHGQGGASITALGKGGASGRFEQALNVAGIAKGRQVTAGRSYKVRALHWVQGETDQNEDMPEATYLGHLTDLIADYRADLPTATGQPEDFPVILSQTSMTYYKPVTVAVAQLAASRTIPGTYVACSHYHLPHYTDNIHLTNVGYYRLGEYHARAHNAVKATGTWKPLAPHTIAAAGNTITLDYDVPTPPLVLDTTAVPAQADMGFTLSGTAAQIIDVAVTGPTTITLTTDRTLSGSFSVGYASDLLDYRARGNVRDSEATTSTHDGAQLANWSLIFRETVSAGAPAGLHLASAAYVKAGAELKPLSFGSL